MRLGNMPLQLGNAVDSDQGLKELRVFVCVGGKSLHDICEHGIFVCLKT